MVSKQKKPASEDAQTAKTGLIRSASRSCARDRRHLVLSSSTAFRVHSLGNRSHTPMAQGSSGRPGLPLPLASQSHRQTQPWGCAIQTVLIQKLRHVPTLYKWRRKSFLPADPTPCCCHREAGAELGCRNDSVGGHQAAVGSRSLGVPVAGVTYTPDAWRGRIRNSLPPLSSCPQMKFWVPIICRGSRVRVPVYHIHLHEVATVFRELAMASGSHS